MLELTDVSLRFGGLTVLDELSLHVNPGEIVALIGPNGAGKTSALNLISGIYRPDAGDVYMDGVSIAGLTPDAVCRRGIARTFQTLRLFPNMSVLENVMAGAYSTTRANLWQIALRTPAFHREEAATMRTAEELLARFGTRLAGYRHDQPAHSLSYANRRRLEIARALMTEPRLLLLDEPAAGMNPHESAEVAELILRLRGEGLTILLIEHDMGLIERVADRVIALNYGRRIAEGTFAQVTGDPQVVAAYLGAPIHERSTA
jgi:ABC-type branched-subunit amino acid transport system ATPase component